jgi:hypothetical protein
MNFALHQTQKGVAIAAPFSFHLKKVLYHPISKERA